MRKFLEFKFVLGQVEKTISVPFDTPFRFVLQFAAESFDINSRISSICNHDNVPIDFSMKAFEIWQEYGCDLNIRLNS